MSVAHGAKWVAALSLRVIGELLRSLVAPRRIPRRLPRRGGGDRALRRLRMTAAEIAEVLGLPLSTVSLWLKRIGLGKRSRLEPPEPPNRYERRHPGELVHVDIKQLGRISRAAPATASLGHRESQITRRGRRQPRRLTGYEYLHVMIDDHSRLAYAEVLDDLTAAARSRFLRRARRLVRRTRRPSRAVMTDNGSAYIAHAYRRAPARARPPPPAHQALPATHQRQSRALHPNAAQRMGLRPHLRQLTTNAPPHSRSTSTATTTDDHTAASATNHRPRD